MKLVRSTCADQYLQHGCVLAIGNFDGMHLGHQAIVRRMTEKAQDMNLPAVLMTFSPSPQEFFRGRLAVPRLTTVSERYLALENSGVDFMIVLPFNRKLARTDAREFIRRHIVDSLHTRYLLVGDDFRFGADRQGDYRMLAESGKEYGFETERLHTMEADGVRISSTLLRKVLKSGDLQHVERLMGRRFSMVGRVTHGDKRGRQLGFPTLNLPLRRVPPMTGVFAVLADFLDGERKTGVANLGCRPTVGGFRNLLEVHLFGFEREIYGKRTRIEFVKKIRDEMKFDSLDVLKEQIRTDCLQARALFDEQET